MRNGLPNRADAPSPAHPQLFSRLSTYTVRAYSLINVRCRCHWPGWQPWASTSSSSSDHQRPLLHGPGWSRWMLFADGVVYLTLVASASSVPAVCPLCMLFRHSFDLRISVPRLGTQCHGSQWYVPSFSRDIGPVIHNSDDLHNHSGDEYRRHPPIPPISDPQPVSADTLPGPSIATVPACVVS